MSEFSPQQVVDLVQSRSAPWDWAIFTARRGPLVARATQGVLYSALWAICAALCLYLSLYVMFHLIPEIAIDIGGVIAPLFGALVFAVVSWRSVRMAWISAQLLMAWRDLWISVTPDGIVDYRGARLGIGYTFDFAETIKIEKTSNYGPRFLSDFALTFWRAHPTQPQRRLASVWFINVCYQHRDQIAQLVMLTQRANRAQASKLPLDAQRSLEPTDARPRMIWNAAGWSCGMLVCGGAMFLLALGLLGLILLTTFGSRDDGGFWIAMGMASFSLIGALACWLTAWRKSDWKIPVKL